MIDAIIFIIILLVPLFLIYISKNKRRIKIFKSIMIKIFKTTDLLLLFLQILLCLFATIICLGLTKNSFVFIFFDLLFGIISIGLIITLIKKILNNN